MNIRFAGTKEIIPLRYIPLRKFSNNKGVVSAFQATIGLDIDTHQGVLKVDKGDYVIAGEGVYSCKPDCFDYIEVK